jgi:hypothetical protein
LTRFACSSRKVAIRHVGAVSVQAVACLMLFGGCKAKAVAPFHFEIIVTNESGQPFPGVPVMVGERELKKTDAAGKAPIDSSQADGESIVLNLRCPDGFLQAEPVTVRVQRTEGQASSRFDRVCKARYRSIGVVVRAENGPNMPVMSLSQEVARTDASGAAHFVMRQESGQSFQIGLVVTDPKLKPQSQTTYQVPVGEVDDVVLWNIKFEREKPKFYVPPKQKGPQNVGPQAQ